MNEILEQLRGDPRLLRAVELLDELRGDGVDLLDHSCMQGHTNRDPDFQCAYHKLTDTWSTQDGASAVQRFGAQTCTWGSFTINVRADIFSSVEGS